jgi:hypothetical protein
MNEAPESLNESNPKPDKPVAIANYPKPYNAIGDRRFEQLVWSVVDLKIKGSGFDKFAMATLMPGVGDQGRDVTLYREGVLKGIIQCKKYASSINPTIFGRDLVKYILYSLGDASLIPDADDFAYYLATSTGFTTDCLDLIDQKLFVKDDIDKWIAYNLKKYKNLEILRGSIGLEQKVWNICQKVTLRKITPLHLDNYLATPDCHVLIPEYFAPPSSLLPVQESALGKDQLLEILRKGSVGLSCQSNLFDNLPGSHICRTATADLLRWISEPLIVDAEDRALNMVLLSAEAGYGKTVVLKDLYDQLIANDTAVLAIKADKLYVKDMEALKAELGIKIPVFDFIEKCKQQFPQLVLIIDQIDALSKSLSGDRNYISTLGKLIDCYTYDENVRIIVSVRPFDLDYDPALRSYRTVKSISMEELSEIDVETVLYEIGINRGELPNKLLRLLKVPNNLDVFCRLVKGGYSSYTVKSIHDLYAELWKQKIIDIDKGLTVSSAELKKTVYTISDRLVHDQRLTVNEVCFEDHQKELNYLASQGLLYRSGRLVGFFHQTFYDFVFARRFAERDVSIIDYVFQSDQSLHIRGQLKMILDYLRSYDDKKYLEALSAIFGNEDVLFHLKHLAISLLAHVDQPTEGEINLVVKVIAASVELRTAFIEKVQCHDWFKILVEHGFFYFLKIEDGFYDRTGGSFDLSDRSKRWELYTAMILFSKFLNRGSDVAWRHVYKFRTESTSYTMLGYIKDWNDDRAKMLLESATSFENDDQLGYMAVLENIAVINIEYSFQKGTAILKDLAAPETLHHGHYSLLEKWAEIAAEKLIIPLYDGISKMFSFPEFTYDAIVHELSFNDVDLVEKDPEEGDGYLFQLLGICLRRSATTEAPEFQTFLKANAGTNNESVLRLIFFALTTNEIVYKDVVFQLFCHLAACQCLNADNGLSAQFRVLFEKAAVYFSDHQTQEVIKILKNWVNRDEVYFKGRSFDKVRFASSWGLGKFAYLLKLPREVVKHDKQLWRQFQELQRRFPSFKDKVRHRTVMAHVVGSPLPPKAYTLMSNKEWLSSFLAYNKENGEWKGEVPIGGAVEHSRAFSAATKDNPSPEKVQLIRKALANSDVERIYPVAGLSGLVEAKVDRGTVSGLFIAILEAGNYNRQLSELIRIARYIVLGEHVDIRIARFLVDCAKLPDHSLLHIGGHERKESDKDLIMQGLNSIPGAAANALTYMADLTHNDLVFETISELWESASDATKGVLLWRFAYLLNLDRERAVQVFTDRLKIETDNFVLACSLWSMQYMAVNDWDGCRPILERLAAFSLIKKEDRKGLFNILYFSFLKDMPGADKMLFGFLDCWGDMGRHASFIIFQNFYKVDNSLDRSSMVLNYMLQHASSISGELNISFSNMDDVRLDDIFPFLEQYVSSEAFRLSESLLSYLTGQCRRCAQISFTLFEKIVAGGYVSSVRGRNFYDEVITLAITIYGALKGSDDEDRRMRLETLKIFDKLLVDTEMRKRAEDILDKVDFGISA